VYVVVCVRRLLQMGVNNAELYNNIGLCCFYAQQYDMTFNCLQRALALATDDCTIADVWYNIAHVALVTIDLRQVVHTHVPRSQGSDGMMLCGWEGKPRPGGKYWQPPPGVHLCT